MKGGTKAAIINNYIYNPGEWGAHYLLLGREWADRPHIVGEVDLIGNVLAHGPSTRANLSLFSLGGEGDLSIYAADNMIEGSARPTPPILSKYSEHTVAEYHQKREPHLPVSGLRIVRGEALLDSLFSSVGARPWERDAIDARILNDALTGTGRIIDSQDEVGGYPQNF